MSVLLFLGGMAWQYAEREYLGDYLLAWTAGRLRDNGYYRFVVWVDRKGHAYIASGDEIERVKMPDGRPAMD